MAINYHPQIEGLARAHGDPLLTAQLRQWPDHFVVTERPLELPCGQGDHLWLWLRKTGCNTQWVAEQLAHWLGIPEHAVAYAGLKDRHAVTQQWFSIKPNVQPNNDADEVDWFNCPIDGIEVLEVQPHDQRLQRGDLLGNRFEITLTEVSTLGGTGLGSTELGSADRAAIEQRLEQIAALGVPNYFGPQRFGRGAQNLNRAERLFAGEVRLDRQQRSMAISAARSWLFNRVLARRIEANNWGERIAGEVLLDRSTGGEYLSHLIGAQQPPGLQLEPSGPLWGDGPLASRRECALLEQEVAEQWPVFSAGLEALGLRQERRLLRLSVDDFDWQWLAENRLQLRFELAKGCFATAVLRELMAQV